ncbi:putative lipid scramblase CLPTM1 [Ptychodera flava]|uniref:putative lipid scramblase CLPTM1 n=1 Tax=Ptychodera flava TaxID=63121 RepID=UPI003969F0BF
MADNTSGGSESSGNNAANNGQVVAQGQNGEVNQQGEQGQQQQQQQQGGWQMLKGFAFRLFIIYMISSFFRGKSNTPTSNPDGTVAQFGQNLFAKGTVMDMKIYISEEEDFRKFNDSKYLFWEERDLEYGDWTSGPNGDGSYTHDGFIEATEKMLNNGTIFIHVYFSKAGTSPESRLKGKYAKKAVAYRSKLLNKYKKKRYHKMVNLLTGETDASPDIRRSVDDNRPAEIQSHWHPNLTINILDDHTPWRQGSIPSPLDKYIDFHPSGDYYPVIYINDYWNMGSDYMPINETTPKLPLSLTFSPISMIKWQMYAAQSMRNQWTQILGDDMVDDDEDDQDSLKKAFLETNPYLLGLTIIVSIVHSIFEFLAFKNDIQFWKNRQSLEGLSVRSVFFGVFQSMVVVLYVLDNETNTVVRISCFIGLLIDMWKITKVMSIKVDRENLLFGFLPRIVFSDKATYVESSTRQYDTLAFKYLSWLLFPLLGCYAVYSLVYQEHKGWYSWVLNMLYGFLLTFGFIMMTPQLFINYKLKSVAHLPWRMMTYKALNTFIDDIFAFVIQMPTLYRIGCFRDDVIFLIYLYQRWIYPVDLKRINEFGTSGEMHGVGQEDGEAVSNGDTPKALEEKSESQSSKTAEDKKND